MFITPTLPIFYKFRTSEGWKIQKFLVPANWVKNLENANHGKIPPGKLNPLCLHDYYVVEKKMGRVPLMDLLNNITCDLEWVVKNE